MSKLEWLRLSNFAIWLVAIFSILFAIGFTNRIRHEWNLSPIENIDKNNFHVSVINNRKYEITYECNGASVRATYDIASKNVYVYPESGNLHDDAVGAITLSSEIVSVSSASILVLPVREVLFKWKDYKVNTMSGVRAARDALKNRWIFLAILSAGGYFVGDYIAKKIDIPCVRANELNWLKSIEWEKISTAMYNQYSFNLSLCLERFRLEDEIRNKAIKLPTENRAEWISERYSSTAIMRRINEEASRLGLKNLANETSATNISESVSKLGMIKSKSVEGPELLYISELASECEFMSNYIEKSRTN